MVSFHPSLIRSRSCSSSASLLLLPSGFPLSIRFLINRFSSGSGYLASVSSFPLSSRFPLTVGLLRCSPSAFAFASLVFPVLSNLVSRVFFPGSSYSALCLFPFIPPGFAPTAVPPVLPFCSRFRALPSRPFSFVRFRSVLTTQPSVLSFPFFPFSPVGGSSGASFLFRPACFHAFLPIPVLSFLHFLSPAAVSPHSSYLSALAFFLSASGLFPLAFALGSGYLASGICLFRLSLSALHLSFRNRLAYINTVFFICQHFL